MRARDSTVQVSRHAQASPETLFRLLDAAKDWPKWSIVGSVKFDHAEDRTRQLVGAHRRFKTGLMVLDERIVVREPGRRIDYALLRGLPLERYVGSIALDPTQEGTLLRWSATFSSRGFGSAWFWRGAIWLILWRMSRDAVHEAEKIEASWGR
jgi:hypothetical protein